jgi:hypothetical protein
MEIGDWRSGSRSEVRGIAFQNRVITKRQTFQREVVESNWVVDLIFELRIIHAKEAAYKQEKPNWRINWENKKGGVTIRSESCEGSQCTTKAEYNKYSITGADRFEI